MAEKITKKKRKILKLQGQVEELKDQLRFEKNRNGELVKDLLLADAAAERMKEWMKNHVRNTTMPDFMREEILYLISAKRSEFAILEKEQMLHDYLLIAKPAMEEEAIGKFLVWLVDQHPLPTWVEETAHDYMRIKRDEYRK